jgi:hypothetical protein
MVEQSDTESVILQSVSTSKDLAAFLQDEIARSESTNVTFELGIGTAQAIATQLRTTANLVAGLLEENRQMVRTLNETLERLKK